MWKSIAIYAILDAAFLAATLAFSASVAVLFGLEAFGITLTNGQALLVASVSATIALGSRILHAVVDARVIGNREIWFAERIKATGEIDRRTVGRASNHYGRLASAVAKGASALCVTVITLVAVPLLLPLTFAVALFAVILLIVIGLLPALYVVGGKMHASSEDLVTFSRDVAIWKSEASSERPSALEGYRKAYFWRIFLSSAFSFLPQVVSILIVLVFVVLGMLDVTLRIGEAFVAFMVAQTYIGMVARVFGALAKSSAFVPAVTHYRNCL